MNHIKHFLYAMGFSKRLLLWYDEHCRELPWRNKRDPYVVWVSEIILQQTRIDQGMAYYHRFLEAFPDVYSLASASETAVLRVWQGLGYYSRATNMHHTAKTIVKEHNGIFPGSSKELLSLKGIGAYTAAAIASIVYNEAVPALDGNVYRLLSRLFALNDSINSSKGKNSFRELAEQLISKNRPGDFNQAMMDFGSLVCRPVNPLCEECIFNNKCVAFMQNKVKQYPVRNEKRTMRHRFFNYFFIEYNDPGKMQVFYARQRKGDDIWKHLYELPLFETDTAMPQQDIFVHPWWKTLFPDNKGYSVSGVASEKKHQLSHQLIHARLFSVRVTSPLIRKKLDQLFMTVDAESFEAMPKPRLLEHLLHDVL